MTAPTPYLHFPGTAREALTFYAGVFGGTTDLNTYEQFGRTDGPADAVAHGGLVGGAVALFAAEAAGDEPVLRCEGLMLALRGTGRGIRRLAENHLQPQVAIGDRLHGSERRLPGGKRSLR